MKTLFLLGLVLSGFVLVGFYDDSFAQLSNKNTLKVSFENNIVPSYEVPLVSGQTFTLNQNHSWVRDETSRYNLVSYSLDGESVKISRTARGDFTLNIPTDSSHTIVFSAVPQYALTVDGVNSFSYLPSSPTNDNWFDVGTSVSINIQKTTEVEPNKVRQEVTGWSLDKSQFWNIEDDGTSFTTPPITMNEYHQVDFFATYQYKLNVLSDMGETTGSGWYEQGVTVPIGVDAGNEGLILNSLSGWEGSDVTYDGNSAQVFIDGPVTVTAKLEKNYSLMIVAIVIPILIVGFIAAKKIKRRPVPPVVVEKTIEKIVEKAPAEPKKQYADKYDETLSVYLTEQIKSKIEDMHKIGILSDSKFSKIKDSKD